jgi:hypothetical protein
MATMAGTTGRRTRRSLTNDYKTVRSGWSA